MITAASGCTAREPARRVSVLSTYQIYSSIVATLHSSASKALCARGFYIVLRRALEGYVMLGYTTFCGILHSTPF